MDEVIRVKGVEFRVDGLSPAAAAYLRDKGRRSWKREERERGLISRLLTAALPSDFARVPVERLASGRTLVIGCAGGVETIGLGGVGLDLDRDAVRVADELGRQAVGARALFLAASGADLPFRDGLFDTLLSEDVVEHIPAAPLRRHLREARRTLKDGGRYVFSTPNRLFESQPKEGHVSLRSYAEWEALAREAGFSRVLTPRRRSGPLGDLEWKKAKEVASPSRLGLSHRGLRMVTIVAIR